MFIRKSNGLNDIDIFSEQNYTVRLLGFGLKAHLSFLQVDRSVLASTGFEILRIYGVSEAEEHFFSVVSFCFGFFLFS